MNNFVLKGKTYSRTQKAIDIVGALQIHEKNKKLNLSMEECLEFNELFKHEQSSFNRSS